MRKNDKFTLSFVMIKLLCDIIIIFSVFILSYFLRFHSNIIAVVRGVPTLSDYCPVFIFGTIIIVILFRNYGLYKGFLREVLPEIFFKIFKGVLFGIFIMMAFSFMYREFSYSRAVALIAFPLITAFVFFERLLIDRMELYLRKTRGFVSKVLILGGGAEADNVAKAIINNRRLGYDIAGFLSDTLIDLKQYGISRPILGKIDSLDSYLEKMEIDEVVLTERGMPREKIIEIILKCEKNLVSFKLVPDIFEMMTSNVDIVNIDGISLLDIHRFPLQSLWARFLKRTVDFIGAAAGLIIFSPVFLIAAALIKLDSRGPVFYKQERCGEDGTIFKIYKFRTMFVGAEDKTGPVWAKENDNRRTRIGGLLRSTNLDEIPQLINVLMGDMSMVGPRPERPYFVNQFKEDVPRYMSRHLIKSGITGWAQVNGLRGDTSIEDRIKYDLYYIENWSIFLDLKILFLTIFARKNAY